MPPELERLLPLAIAILAVVTLALLLRAILGVNTTHEKLDEILREVRDIKRKHSGPNDPPPDGPDEKRPDGGE